MKAVILAGGSGTRLWPVSRKKTPKQIKPILGKQTMLAKTYERLRKGFLVKDIYIATNHKQYELVKQDLSHVPESNFIVEPAKKDTAPAIGLAAAIFSKMDPKEIMININSDHFIRNEKEYMRIIKLADKMVLKKPKAGVLIGINPTYPETGYGYIKMGTQAVEIGKDKIFQIDRFEEKPDMKTAIKYMEGWEYLWNSGCFAWRVDTLLDLYKKYLPLTYKLLMNIRDAVNTSDFSKVLKSEFKKITPISMDYGIIEKAPELYVIPADFGWSDVGNWRTVKDINANNGKKNIKKGKVIDVDCEDSLIYNYSENIVGAVGVKGMVLIKTEDATLLCPKEKAQDVKKIVEILKEKGMEEYL